MLPNHTKNTGKLDTSIQETMYSESLLGYLHKKNDICDAKINMVTTEGLKSYLKHHNILTRASIVKIIHRWFPTSDCLYKQGQSDSNLCPCRAVFPETADHILECNNKEARNKHQELLYKCCTI